MQWIVELGAARTGRLGRGLMLAGLSTAVLLTASCGSGTPALPDAGAKPLALRDFIDAPKPGQTVTGKFVAFGWAAPFQSDGIKRISASARPGGCG